MQDSYSNSRSNNQNRQDISPDIQINNDELQIQRIPSVNQNNYMRIQSQNERIDEEAIINQFRGQLEDQREQELNLPKINKKKKIQKVPQKSYKKHGLISIKNKWKAEMEQSIGDFKQILNEQKKSYDSKQKEYLLNFFKALLDGYYQLKDHGQASPNQLSKNQKRVISPQCDFNKYLKQLVDNFDAGFREAKLNGKIQNTKNKWMALINNMRDQYNFELRRKLLTKKIVPNHVIQNNDEFLMSEQAKLQAQRVARNILAQANADLEKIAVLQYNDSNSEEESNKNQFPEQLQNLRSTFSNESLERKNNRQRQKLEEFKEAISEERIMRLKERIIEDLKGTSSYDRIMGDFLSKFGNPQNL